MRRIATITLVALAAVSSAGAAQAPPTLAPGMLTVALSLPSPGFQAGAVRPGGAVVAARGFEIDLARSLAARLGLKRVRFVNEPSFPRLLAARPEAVGRCPRRGDDHGCAAQDGRLLVALPSR